MTHPRLLLLAAAVLALAPGAAAACSLEPGYREPSNLELAAQAETIVLARVVAGQPGPGEDPSEGTVTIRPLAAVKGPLPAGDIALKGMMLSRDAGSGLGVLSNPYEFARAHPVSYTGACWRYVFPLGTTALFFLRSDHEGMWAPAGGAFARWAEDVPGEDAPWVQLARVYAHAAALPEEDRAPFLEGEREALLTRADEPVAQLLAADIARQLGLPGAPEPLAEGDEAPEPRPSAVDEALEAMRRAGATGGGN